MNPVEDFLESVQPEKTASWLGDVGKSFAHGMALGSPTGQHNVAHAAGAILTTGGVAAGIGAGVHHLSGGMDSLIAKFQKPRQYEAMMEAHPTLQEQDASHVQMYFNALHKMAPEMAAEPLLAGSFVRQMLSRAVEGGPAIPMDTTKMLTDISKNMNGGGAKTPAYLAPLMSGKVPYPKQDK